MEFDAAFSMLFCGDGHQDTGIVFQESLGLERLRTLLQTRGVANARFAWWVGMTIGNGYACSLVLLLPSFPVALES